MLPRAFQAIAALSVAFSSLLILPMPAAAQATAQNRQGELYVSVVDKSGRPVQGVGPADLVVREDGVAREVLSVRPATAPMQIALLVDTSQAMTPALLELRQALTAFIDALAGKNEIALITYGDRPTIVVDYTSDKDALKKAAGRLFAVPGSGAYLLESIVDASRGLQKRDAPRPVIAAVGMEAVEFSNQHPERVLEAMENAGTAFHAVMLSPPGSSAPISEEIRNRNTVLDRGTRQTGGRREHIITPMAFEEELKELAQELSQQYLVTYGRPESLIPPEAVTVESRKPGTTARGTLARRPKGD